MCTITPEIIKFIREHENDDLNKLLLSAPRFPQINIRFAVEQITARKTIKDKVPEWYAHDNILYPSTLSIEQCSSESTARYKQRLVNGKTLCDLTGGLGVDTYYLSRVMQETFHVEHLQNYHEAAVHNFHVLQADNIKCIMGDAYEIAPNMRVDTFYIDPARRTNVNKRIFALADCEPNILNLKTTLLTNAQRVIVKISPMADITEITRLLPETKEIHVIAVKNECKEILLILEKGQYLSPPIYTINITPQKLQSFSFTLTAEHEASTTIATSICQYLYEPNAAILKSGAFKSISNHYELEKLDTNSHLYTSNQLLGEFPGRIFHVEKVVNFSEKHLKSLRKYLPQANITTRNFIFSVAEIRKKSGIKEGGDIYLFATTLHPKRPVFIITRKI